MIETAVAALQSALAESRMLPRLTTPLPIVCASAGGKLPPQAPLGDRRDGIAGRDQRHLTRARSAQRDGRGDLVGAMLNI